MRSESRTRAPVFPPFDLLVVGSGLFGATFTSQALECGLRVLVIDQRSHPGGNCHSESVEGIEVHKYGPHIFHTADEATWDYVRRFSDFLPYTHRIRASTGGQLYSFPVNLETIRSFHPEVRDSGSARRLLDSFGEGRKPPENFEEFLIGRVGEKMYRAFYRGYSRKQWGRDPRDLPAFIARRIPIRTDCNDRYFDDPYEGIPVKGYTAMIRNMLAGAEVRLRTDYFEYREHFDSLASTVLYTGELDRFFDHRLGTLEYRSLAFEESVLEMRSVQPCAIINYCDEAVPYTRITEHKHFTGVQTELTVVSREYPDRGSEKFYPVNNAANNALHADYSRLAAREENVLFGGRLAEYKYFDMDHVIQSARRKFRRFAGCGFRKIPE